MASADGTDLKKGHTAKEAYNLQTTVLYREMTSYRGAQKYAMYAERYFTLKAFLPFSQAEQEKTATAIDYTDASIIHLMFM